MKIKNTIKLRTYDILADKVEEGILMGWNRAHKHTDNPNEELIKNQIHEEVMNSLSEVINYEN